MADTAKATKQPKKQHKARGKQTRANRDFYVSDTSPLPSQLEACEKLLEKEKEVFVHGVGALVSAAINLALQIEAGHPNGAVRTSVTTSTVDTIDEWGERRPGSCVSVHLQKP